MTASFLQASLFTSVVAFGVSAMAVVLGLLLVLLGWACGGSRAGPLRCRPLAEERHQRPGALDQFEITV